MIKRILLSLGIIALLAGCSASAPNDVTLTTTPGVCVNSVVSGYESSLTTYSSAFPMNSYMTASSPYCMSVTMTNNNNGQNSNNIQVYQGGLTLTYTAGGISYSANMIDFNAAGLYQGNFNYLPVQQLGNIALFDPNNCVTTIGAHVNTLNKAGGQCTFYLQIVNEYSPTGDYPINLSVNYTNGNQNYTVQANVYQHSSMYIGGAFTSPSQNIAWFNANSSNAALPLITASTISAPIQLMARDGMGNVYAYDGTSIHIFNSESLIQTIAAPSGTINQLAGDSFGNVFAATSNGLSVYNAASGSSATWTSVANISGAVNAVRPASINQQDVLYFTSTSAGAVESCVYSANSCTTPTSIVTASGFNNAALNYSESNGNVYWANNTGVYVESSLLGVTGGPLTQIGQLGVDQLGFVYAASTSTNAVYANLANSSQLAPVVDSNNNTLTGSPNGVLLRSYALGTTSPLTLYSYGSGLSSSSAFSNAYLAYINMVVNTSNYYAASSAWTPVSGLNGQVNSVIVSSRLANN